MTCPSGGPRSVRYRRTPRDSGEFDKPGSNRTRRRSTVPMVAALRPLRFAADLYSRNLAMGSGMVRQEICGPTLYSGMKHPAQFNLSSSPSRSLQSG